MEEIWWMNKNLNNLKKKLKKKEKIDYMSIGEILMDKIVRLSDRQANVFVGIDTKSISLII